jgi:hypothetical protein
MIVIDGYGTANHIYLKNLDIHHIKGQLGSGSTTVNGAIPKRTGGIYFTVLGTTETSSNNSRFNDILIDNLDIKENNKTENESVKEMSGGSTDSVPIFGDVMKTIYKALDLSATDEATINSKLQNYTNVEKYKLINSANKYLEDLVDADKKIIKLEMEDKLSKDNIVLFKTTLAELAKLQGLILIRKASENCDELIKVLLEAFKNKLSVVNDILINNLNDQKGGDNIFKHKFFKYKTKYLNLLKNKV